MRIGSGFEKCRSPPVLISVLALVFRACCTSARGSATTRRNTPMSKVTIPHGNPLCTRPFLTFLWRTNHHFPHHPASKEGPGINTTLRRCPSLRAIHGVLPCRYPIVTPLTTGRVEQLCADLPTNLNTFRTRRYTRGSHPWGFTKLSHTVRHRHTTAGMRTSALTQPDAGMLGSTQGA